MTQDNEYDLKPPETPPKPKPGDPGWVEPTPIIEKADPVPQEPAVSPEDLDITNNKAMAILGYIFFIIPLVAAGKSSFARFHANQGLMVFILWCIAFVIIAVLQVGYALLNSVLYANTGIRFLWSVVACFAQFLIPLILIVMPIIFAIIGIINAANGERKPLPLIGHWTLIK
jgi:uncharacterized membrane protein